MSSQKQIVQKVRRRSKNFTTEEEELLIDLVEVYKNIIENKKSDAVIWKQKGDAWRKIENKFAATSGTHRHWKALRDKYDLMKRKSKIEMANSSPSHVSPVSSKIASMLKELHNKYDSDSCIPVNGTHDIDLESVIEHGNYNECAEMDQSNEELTLEKPDFSCWKPATLRRARSKEVFVGAKRRRNVEEERAKLLIVQQNFYRDENIRAQEKHEQELKALKLKNEILQLEITEKKSKLN